MSDLTYKTDGLVIRLYANTPAGEAAFNEIAKHKGFEGGIFLSHLFPSVKAQLKAAGITLSKQRSTQYSVNDGQLLKDLGLEM